MILISSLIRPSIILIVKNKSAGFSLVEVAIALGIFSFGLMSIVGLLGVGLSSLRGNVDRMAEVQILDWARATTKAARSDASMSSIVGNDYGFDGDSLYTGAADLNSIYSLRLESSNIPLPGSQEEIAGVIAVIRSPARGNQFVSTNVFWFDK